MKIYIDILFIKYFIVNYCLIEIASTIMSEKTTLVRKIISTVITTTYSIIVLLYNLKISGGSIGRIILSIIIVLISFKPRNVSDIVRKMIILYVVTYLVGGIMSSIINEIANQNITITLAIIIGCTIILLYKKILENKIRKDEFICNIKIFIKNKVVVAKALIDTGHDLFDVITGDTVIIINENKIKEMSEELYMILKDFSFNVSDEYQGKIRMITYSSIGNDKDILYGISADSVAVYYDGKEIENKNVVIAINKGVFKKYDAIIGLNLIQGGNVIGNSFIVKA